MGAGAALGADGVRKFRRSREARGNEPPIGNALEWTRTTTGETPHKALNLARLPIPPRARGRGEYRRGPGLAGSVREPRYTVRTHVRLDPALGARRAMVDLTKRQQEIFEFIKRYSAATAIRRRCATSARRSGSPPPRRCTPTSRTSRRSGCCGATRRSRARSSCSTGPSAACATWCGRPACRSSARSRPAQPILAEENVEDYVPDAGDRRRRRRRVPAARARRVDEGRRHPRRRPRRRRARRTRRATARSSSRSWARRRP